MHFCLVSTLQQNNLPKVSLINTSRNRQIGMRLVMSGRNLRVSCLAASSELTGLRHKLCNLTVEPLSRSHVRSLLSHVQRCSLADQAVRSCWRTAPSSLPASGESSRVQTALLLWRKRTKDRVFISCVGIIFPPFLTGCLSVDLKGSWGLQTPPSATALGGSLQPSDLRLLSDTPCPPSSALLLNQHPHLVARRANNCVIEKKQQSWNESPASLCVMGNH